MTWWMVKGPTENWRTSFRKGNIWGVAERYNQAWRRMKAGDNVLFYATNPVKGIIGYGSVKSTFRDNKPFWESEVRENKSYWNLRFSFDVSFCLPETQWGKKAVRVSLQHAGQQRGLQRVKEEVADELIRALQSS